MNVIYQKDKFNIIKVAIDQSKYAIHYNIYDTLSNS